MSGTSYTHGIAWINRLELFEIDQLMATSTHPLGSLLPPPICPIDFAGRLRNTANRACQLP
jgi:hypothetical protein